MVPPRVFGVQVAVLVFDVWYGWIDHGFRAWLKKEYAWIKLLYVPPACTPIGQPMDAGIIAKMKAQLRASFGKWALDSTWNQLARGVLPEDVRLDLGFKTMKPNMAKWISDVTIPSDEIRKCWAKTGLLKAWDPEIQRQAVQVGVEKLFRNDVNSKTVVDRTADEEEDVEDVEEEPEDPGAGIMDAVEVDATTGVPLTAEQNWEIIQDFILPTIDRLTGAN